MRAVSAIDVGRSGADWLFSTKQDAHRRAVDCDVTDCQRGDQRHRPEVHPTHGTPGSTVDIAQAHPEDDLANREEEGSSGQAEPRLVDAAYPAFAHGWPEVREGDRRDAEA